MHLKINFYAARKSPFFNYRENTFQTRLTNFEHQRTLPSDRYLAPKLQPVLLMLPVPTESL